MKGSIMGSNLLSNRAIAAFVITVIVLVVALFVSIPNIGSYSFLPGRIVELANLGLQNLFFRQIRILDPNNAPKILIVAIDDKTLTASGLGRWQDFRRAYYASVIHRLRSDGAFVIGLDILFSEPSPKENADDEAFRQSLLSGSVVLGMSSGHGLLPIDPFIRTDCSLGSFDFSVDPVNDTVYGYMPQQFFSGKTYESFSLAVLREYLDKLSAQSTAIPPLNPENENYDFYNDISRQIVLLRDKENSGLIRFAFRPSTTFQTISFLDVYHGTYDPSLAKEAIVLIGASASALHDEFFSPIGTIPGVYLHANAIDSAYQKLRISFLSFYVEICILIFITFALSLFLLSTENRFAQIGFSLLGILGSLFLQWLFFWGAWFSWWSHAPLPHILFNFPAQIFIIIILLSVFSMLYKYLYEEKEKRHLKNALSQYLAEDIVFRLLDNYKSIRLGGDKREITSFFSDIAGFTTLSEQLTPEDLVRFLSTYLKHASDVVIVRRGYINKYEGDAIMALWWAFGEESQQAFLACHAALETQQLLSRLNEEFRRTYGFTIEVRIGITKGVAVVGNFGSEGRKIEFTAIGDPVNTASRLEGINKVYGTKICVGSSVRDELESVFFFRKLDVIRAKGKKNKITIYELMGTQETVTATNREIATIFERGLLFYFAKNFQESLHIFESLVRDYSDRPSEVFMERSAYFLHNGVPEDWDGVWQMKEK